MIHYIVRLPCWAMALLALASLETIAAWLSLALVLWAGAEFLGALCLVDRLVPLKHRSRKEERRPPGSAIKSAHENCFASQR